MSKWHQRYIDLAHTVASWSKDPSTKVGAVIVSPNREVLSTGYNGFPRGMIDRPDWYADREFKHKHVVHAEANAILNAARYGVRLQGCTLYVTHPPCPSCARTIAQAGIEFVVYDIPTDEGFKERWPLQTMKEAFTLYNLQTSELTPLSL
ncbi:CMP deaminase [Motiliproteus coralliicola]|uniref:CMP deaminase n=1 Tax=Motiliproteus coralliicola TaxID=2283196 RepID=A0A369WSU7_9GAMM|nr:dCMP deaminase family protein [Motiliproteus coralliicola]RDE25170.1 CMP deaminase [Motiliproteus coralliicola]